MKTIMQVQAEGLNTLYQQALQHHRIINQFDDLKAHLYLESMQVPLDAQDRILTAMHRLKRINAAKLFMIIEQSSRPPRI